MIPTSYIHDPMPFAPGWLGEYCQVVGGDRAPWSFHLLCGLAALTSVVGRRALISRPAGILYPPISAILLGRSGVGKSIAMDKMKQVVKLATEGRTGFYLGEGGFTTSGLVDLWCKLQRTNKLKLLEGLHIEDEILNILKERKGTENITGWLIKVLAHNDVVDLTRMYGKLVVKDVTVAFVFGSTLSYLRRAVSIDEFTGGFMHRFLIAHELEQRDGAERSMDELALADLAAKLRDIAASAPPKMPIAKDAEAKLGLFQGQASKVFYDNHHMSGFWNRYTMLILKVALAYALARMSAYVALEDVEMAEGLIRSRFYPPLSAITLHLALGPAKRELLEVAENLLCAGPEGWTQSELLIKIGKPLRQALEAKQTLVNMKLLFEKGGRVYGRSEWAEGA